MAEGTQGMEHINVVAESAGAYLLQIDDDEVRGEGRILDVQL